MSAWLIYGMATATETSRQAVMILQYLYLLPACAPFGFADSLVKLMSQK